MKRLFLLLLTTLCGLGAVRAQYTNQTDLPTVYIETFDGNGIYSKTVYEYCRLILE